MALSVCRQPLFACRMIYRSSATTNLSNSCTCGLERFPSVRNDTFVDSELCSYTGDGPLLLQLFDHSSACEVIQFISIKLGSKARVIGNESRLARGHSQRKFCTPQQQEKPPKILKRMRRATNFSVAATFRSLNRQVRYNHCYSDD
ncbi:hypothetical protein TNCV_3885491 [Trichonephila clavipes]|nr:hypothetical protein TNCV_3885491 [Trichonephila clavipes]